MTSLSLGEYGAGAPEHLNAQILAGITFYCKLSMCVYFMLLVGLIGLFCGVIRFGTHLCLRVSKIFVFFLSGPKTVNFGSK